jgi:hypothetical protein
METIQECNTLSILEQDPLKKRARKSTAKALPPGLTQNMMKKYVVYYHEWLNPEHTRSREFFKIEKHPKLKKIWIGTKSNKISLQDKLKQANKRIEDLEIPNDNDEPNDNHKASGINIS